MPKLSRSEIGSFLDPGSSEHSPTREEIERNRGIRERVLADVAEIEDRLEHPGRDSMYDHEDERFTTPDPEVFWSQLAYMRKDFVDQIQGDPEMKTELETRIQKVERKVYKQFIPFIKSRIRVFGRHHSPLESGWRGGPELTIEDIQNNFAEARFVLKSFEISDDERFDILVELDRLQKQAEQYDGEPTLFTFERIEEKLRKELARFEHYDLVYGGPFSRSKIRAGGLEDGGKVAETRQRQFDLFLAQAHQLKEIASRMLTPAIKTGCEVRSTSLYDYVAYLKVRDEAPRVFLSMEGEMKSVLYRIQHGEAVEQGEVETLGQRLAELRDQRLGLDFGEFIKNLEQLFSRMKNAFERASRGEEFDEEEDRFRFESGDVNWAWDLLGVERDAGMDIVKRAYRKLAQKYHPDRNKGNDAHQKMQKLNEAYSLIERLNKDK